MLYNWQLEDWPNFHYSQSSFEVLLPKIYERFGRIDGLYSALSYSDQEEAISQLLSDEALKTSEIENEYLNPEVVISSIRKNLGFSYDRSIKVDSRSEGVAQLMVDIHQSYMKPLSEEMLFNWHLTLFKDEKSVAAGSWRSDEEAMQIVSGRIDHPTIHFEAPPSKDVPKQMRQFIHFYNQSELPYPIKAGIIHLYFESIHPFEDGNGRIGRALAEKALSEGFGKASMISLSKTIEKNKSNYYAALKEASKTLHITAWLEYFTKLVIDAQELSTKTIQFTVKKVRFYERYNGVLNERQKKVIEKMFKAGPDGFEGGMKPKKYMSIAKTSKATATRDIQQLVEHNIFKSYGAGRSTHYHLVI